MKFYTFVILFIFSVFVSAQKTWYVSTSGNNSALGNESNPFRDINYAIVKASERDVIKVAGGVYTEPVLLNKSFITLMASDPLNKPVIDASSAVFSKAYAAIKWTSNSIDDFYSHSVVDGFIIRNATAGTSLNGIMINGNYNKVRNCELYNINRTGILVQGTGNIIEYNIISGINGIPAEGLAGNNISVESYYYDGELRSGLRRNSEKNIIRYNILKNNPTHFGINLFPNTGDPEQPAMEGNRILNNYIDSTGGAIYCRYQRNMDIFNNYLLNSLYDSVWGTTGTGITIDVKTGSPHPVPFDAGRIKIYNNTIAGNYFSGVRNFNSNTLSVLNNIFSDNHYLDGASGHGHLIFAIDAALISENTKVDNNLYFGRGCWEWGKKSYCIFKQWQSASKRDWSSFAADPLFTDKAKSDYRVMYRSPAKNKGRDLYSSGIINDYFDNPRPYWNSSFDIGAHEVTDAQIKISVSGVSAEAEIKHILKSSGSVWEKSGTSFLLTNDKEIDSAVYTSSGNSTENNRDLWHGYTYKWLAKSLPDSNSKFGAAFYKVSNDFTNNYFFLDTRDAVMNSSPDIFIKLNLDSSGSGYYYFSDSIFKPITNGQVLRVWEINKGKPYTFNLENYWNNALNWFRTDKYTSIAWGPFSGESVTGYNLYKISGIHTEKFSTPDSVYFFSDSTLDNESCEFFVRAVFADGSEGAPSNVIKITGNDHQDIPVALNDFSLSQNYPNPFNPSTKISYSLPGNSYVKIKVFNVLGELTEILADKVQEAGKYELNFNSGRLAGGIYIVRMDAVEIFNSAEFSKTIKMLLLK